MLMRALAAGGCAAFLASCATAPSSVLPPVRDGALYRSAEARPAPDPGRSDGRVSGRPERVSARSSVSGPRTPAPGRPEPPPARLEEGGAAAATPLLPYEPAPREGTPRGANSAVVALVGSAREAEKAGQYGRAAAALERALKVDPRDPRLWHRLAAVRYRQGRHAEAEALALRSLNLRPADRGLDTWNWRVIAAARHARGDEAGAREAGRRANFP